MVEATARMIPQRSPSTVTTRTASRMFLGDASAPEMWEKLPVYASAIPPKPRNASDTMDAATSVRGSPRKARGGFASSIRERTPEKSSHGKQESDARIRNDATIAILRSCRRRR